MSTITQFPSGNTQYRIEFDYLARTFVVVTLVNSSNPTLNRVLEVGRDYRFLNPTMIEMLVDQSGFDIVRIHRQTGTDLVVDFRNGSVLTASDLTNAELQAIHIAEEGRDQTVDLAKEYADAAGSSAGNAKDSEDEARRIAENIKASGLIGYITRRSFEKGFNVITWNEVLLWEEDGGYYRWDGTLPKNVPAGSTPETAGGIGLGAWVSVGDAALRSQLSSHYGATMVRTTSGNTVQKYLEVYLSSHNGDLQQALDSGDTVYIDMDYALVDDIIIDSGKTLKTINGYTITHSGGSIRTAAVSSAQYYKDVPENVQIDITESVVSGSTTIKVASTAGLTVGTKLILKNGYCDMWRVLESGDAMIQRKAVNSLTYRSEIVEILNISDTTLTTTPVIYDYPLTPTVYGYIANENALTDYAGYTRPSVTKMLYSDITLDLDINIPAASTSQVITLAYIDGLDLSMRVKSDATIHAPFKVAMSEVNIHDVVIDGHKGGVLWVQETCKGLMTNLIANDWRGGHDSPFTVMLLSNINISNVSTTASEKQVSSSACYINTCDGGNITNVFGKNLARVADFSFSRQVVASAMTGKNCDFIAGAFASSNCKAVDGTVDGYCFQNPATTIYTPTLIYCSNTTNVSYSNISRINDKGYGRIRINGSIGVSISKLSAPETTLHTILANKDSEIATGNNNNAVTVSGASIGGFVRESAYYNAGDEYGAVYPMTKYENIRVKNGGVIDIGGKCNQEDVFDFYSTSTATIGDGVLGVVISGFLGGITCLASSKNTCYPYIKNLKLVSKPAAGVFNSVDTMMTDGSGWPINFYNGAKISDVYSRKTYTNSGNKGSSPVWTAQ